MFAKQKYNRFFGRLGALSNLIAILCSTFFVSAAMPVRSQAQTPADRAAALLAQMTLDEKIGQMTLIENNSIPDPQAVATYLLGGVLSGGDGLARPNTPASWAAMIGGYQRAALSTRLKIPILYGIDAVHGIGGMYGATIFPHNVGLGAANDPPLVEQIGMATADEMAGVGLYWDYGPVLAVLRDPRWGRAYESYGEDTALVGTLGAAFIKGLQSGGAYATAKHYVGDGGVGWGTSTTVGYKIDQGVTQGDLATLRAVHLPPYKAAIDAGALTVMASFSSFDGVKMHANKALLTDVLKGELGFKGFIVSDWGAFDQLKGNAYQQIVTAINAGIDMNMVPYKAEPFMTTLKKAVEAGDVSQARIDDAVRRILTVKYAMGLFEHPFADPAKQATVGSEAHRALARSAVAKSLVLLKNQNQALPLTKGVPVLVSGKHADDIGLQTGGWTMGWQGSAGPITVGTTILEGIKTYTTTAYQLSGVFTPEEIGAATVGVAVIGELPYAEGKGDDGELTLSPRDIRLVKQLRSRVKTLIVVVVSGRPLILGDVLDSADAVVAAWLPGSEGAGVADGLFGVTPFTGKLSVSWPSSVDQLPFDHSKPLTGAAAPLFPFGYGLAK